MPPVPLGLRTTRSHLDAFHGAARDAWRAAIRRPTAFVLMALTIALGVGATAAVLGAADRVLFRPLPVDEGHRLAAIYAFDERNQRYASTSYQDYLDYQRRLSTFDDVAAYLRLPLRVTLGNSLARLGGEATTSNYFSMLRVRPIAGRTLADSRGDNAWPLVAMISERQWRTRFDGDPAIVGRTMVVEGHTLTVVGVVADDFISPNLGWGQRPGIWLPMEAVETLFPTFREARVFADRTIPAFLMIGRLAESASIASAQAEADVIVRTESDAMPEASVSLRVFEAGRAKFWPANRDMLLRSFGAFAIAVVLLLALTFSNLTTVLTQQAMSRRPELAVRLALGAGRRALTTQIAAEAAALGLAGAVLSIAVSALVLRALTLFPGVFGIGLTLDLSVDVRTVVLCGALSFALTLLATAGPFAAVYRRQLLRDMKLGQRTTTAPMTWARYSLVALQVTASGVLLAGTLLVASSAANATRVELGFDIDRLATVSLESPPAAGDANTTLTPVIDAIASQPGVISVTRTSRLPLDRTRSIARLSTTATEAEMITAEHVLVDAAYFDTLGITIRRGRTFSVVESANALPVAVVSETLARRLWPDSGGVGERIAIEQQGGGSRTLEVIGVSADTRYREVWDESSTYIYTTQWPAAAIPQLVARTTAQPATAHLVALRRGLGALPEGVSVVGIETGSERLDAAAGPMRSAGVFFGGLAAVAALVALLGLHATLTHTVELRTREIALRQALGATPAQVIRSVFQTPLCVVLAAAVVGAFGAVALAPLLAAQTRGLESDAWAVYALSILLIGSGCFLVAARSAIKALRLPLMHVLRDS